MSSLLIYAEHRSGKLKKSTLEAITKGSQLAKELSLTPHIVLIGSGISGLANEAANYGVTSVLVADDASGFERLFAIGTGKGFASGA